MSLHSSFRQDKKTTWLAVTPVVQVLCAYCDPMSPSYTAVMSRNIAPVRKLVERKLLPPDKDREIALRTFIEVCVQDWRTVLPDGSYRPEIEVMDGEWLPYSPENALRVFTEYPQFFLDTSELARDLTNYQTLDEDARKNSRNA